MRSYPYTTVENIIKVVTPSWDKGTSPITSRSMTLIHLLWWSLAVKRSFKIVCYSSVHLNPARSGFSKRFPNFLFLLLLTICENQTYPRLKIIEHQNNAGQYNTNIFFVSVLEMTVITSFLHGLVTQFLTTRKKNFKILSPTGKLVLFWQMTIFVILIKVEFLSPQVRPVTRIGRWAQYRLFIPASISGTESLNRSHKILRF